MIKLKLKIRTIIALLSILTPALFLTSSTNAYKVESFPTPNPSTLAGGLTISSDGSIWFIKPEQRKVVKSDKLGNMTEYVIPQIDQLTPDSYVGFGSMAADDSSNILFTSNDRGPAQTNRSGYIRRVTSEGQINATLVTIPETTTNTSITPSRMGLFGIKYIGNDTYWLTGGSLEDGYTIAMKVDLDGQVLSYWESAIEEGGPIASVMDQNKNLWIALKGKLVKITLDGQGNSIQLNNMSNIIALESDSNNDIWVVPWSQDYSNTTTPIAKINSATNNGVSYFQFPEGKTAVPLQAISKGPDGNIWISTMNSSDQSPLRGLALSRLSLAGILSETDILNSNQVATSIKLDKNNILWALTSNVDPDSDEGLVANSVKLIKISPDATVIVNPRPPKTGNTAIFILITSLVLSSVLLFSSYIHQKHIKTIATTK